IAETCLRENERRIAGYDPRLLRPRLVPRLVRQALRMSPRGKNGAPAALRRPMAGLTDYQGSAGIVTGASSGLGAQLARDLAARGMRVALLARRADRLAALADEIRRGGGEAVAVPCDVAERA